MRILGISIDRTVVLLAFIEEVEFDIGLMTILVALATNEPIVRSLSLTSDGNVIGRLSFEIDALVPVANYVANELEGIVELLVVLRQVSSHLQG